MWKSLPTCYVCAVAQCVNNMTRLQQGVALFSYLLKFAKLILRDWWSHPTISVTLSLPAINLFPTSGYFTGSELFTLGGQRWSFSIESSMCRQVGAEVWSLCRDSQNSLTPQFFCELNFLYGYPYDYWKKVKLTIQALSASYVSAFNLLSRVVFSPRVGSLF